MKSIVRLAALATLAFAVTNLGFARNSNKNEGNFTLQTKTQVGSAELTPGQYKAQWTEESGGAVKVDILQHGKTVVTVEGKLKDLQQRAPYDAVVTKPLNDNLTTIDEIDFSNRTQALVLGE